MITNYLEIMKKGLILHSLFKTISIHSFLTIKIIYACGTLGTHRKLVNKTAKQLSSKERGAKWPDFVCPAVTDDSLLCSLQL